MQTRIHSYNNRLQNIITKWKKSSFTSLASLDSSISSNSYYFFCPYIIFNFPLCIISGGTEPVAFSYCSLSWKHLRFFHSFFLSVNYTTLYKPQLVYLSTHFSYLGYAQFVKIIKQALVNITGRFV